MQGWADLAGWLDKVYITNNFMQSHDTNWWGWRQAAVQPTVCSASPATSYPWARDDQETSWSSAALGRSWSTAVDPTQSSPMFQQFATHTTKQPDIQRTKIFQRYWHWTAPFHWSLVVEEHSMSPDHWFGDQCFLFPSVLYHSVGAKQAAIYKPVPLTSKILFQDR